MFCAVHFILQRGQHILKRMHCAVHNTTYTKYILWKQLCAVQNIILQHNIQSYVLTLAKQRNQISIKMQVYQRKIGTNENKTTVHFHGVNKSLHMHKLLCHSLNQKFFQVEMIGSYKIFLCSYILYDNTYECSFTLAYSELIVRQRVGDCLIIMFNDKISKPT